MGIARLLLVTATIVAIWMIVLPWLGSRPAISRHIETMEAAGVQPGAMFYTELERLPLRSEWIEQHLVLWP